jgi:uncharacterized protein YbjT (DUF2867 family)
MIVVMGGTGNVGRGVVAELLRREEHVGIVTRNPDSVPPGIAARVDVIVADAAEPAQLQRAFRRATRAFLLNPPADVAADTDAVEQASADAIVLALDGSGLEKVVAASTYGAQPGDRIGDLGVLWNFEEDLRSQPIPAAIDRGAYYMTNWDDQLESIRTEGVMSTMLPADATIPMVDPSDLGVVAARRLLSGIDDDGVIHVEGPRRYSPGDVAAAFADVLGRDVTVRVTPREDWEATYLRLGFSPEAAISYTRMTRLAVDEDLGGSADAERGPTTIHEHVRRLVSGLMGG